MEEWKDIDEFINIYQISNYGNIRRNSNLSLLSISVEKSGYCRCNLYYNRRNNIRSVHRLAAIAFLPNTDKKSHVHHIDGNKQNNDVSNLIWVTQKEHGALQLPESKKKFRETYLRNRELRDKKLKIEI
jgi:hypothetical protein